MSRQPIWKLYKRKGKSGRNKRSIPKKKHPWKSGKFVVLRLRKGLRVNSDLYLFRKKSFKKQKQREFQLERIRPGRKYDERIRYNQRDTA